MLNAIAAQRSEGYSGNYPRRGRYREQAIAKWFSGRFLLVSQASRQPKQEFLLNIYGGDLLFKRLCPDGTVWILGQFENRPGKVRVAFQRSFSEPQNSELKNGRLTGSTDADSCRNSSQPPTFKAG